MAEASGTNHSDLSCRRTQVDPILIHNNRARLLNEGEQLEKLAGTNVEILGHLSRKKVREYMRRAKAFIFAAEEDFGIVPLEAQACGTPVIAYGKGGAKETIVGITTSDGIKQKRQSITDSARPIDKIKPATGIFFYEQTPDSLAMAISEFAEHSNKISASACRENALRFSRSHFRESFAAFVDTHYREFQGK